MPAAVDRMCIEMLMAVGEGAPNADEKLRLLQRLREMSPSAGAEVDKVMVKLVTEQREALIEAGASQEKVRELLEKLTSPPWHPAVFLALVEIEGSPKAMVAHNGTRRVVEIAGGIDPSVLQAGTGVFLTHELNALVATTEGHAAFSSGETSRFNRYLGEGPNARIAIRWRDEELVVSQSAALAEVELKPGDLVRWDRGGWMAMERIEQEQSRRFLIDEIPSNIGRHSIGGQDANIDHILSALTMSLLDPDKAATYGVTGRQTIMLLGAPGLGKTLSARIAVAELARLSDKKCHFWAVKPGEWENCYVGETEKLIRETFRTIREQSEGGIGILFLDEIESIGRRRGSALNGHIADKFLAALLCELDGLLGRGNISVLSAGNRIDLLDQALADRLSETRVEFRRPDIRGARSIFQIHLPDSYLYNPNGASASDTRAEVIETALAMLYNPNSGGDICRIQFRDGQSRTILVSDLMSGRLIEQMCKQARMSACLRDIRGGQAGITVADMQCAVADAVDKLSGTLTPSNARDYLSDLPQDCDVVAVEPLARRVRRHEFINGR